MEPVFRTLEIVAKGLVMATGTKITYQNLEHIPRSGGAVIPINARASGGGRLFGSIGPADVVEAIKAAKGIDVDRRNILLPEHIKETGSFEVTVELFRDVATVVTVEVSPAS